jgi:hypothetical protein
LGLNKIQGIQINLLDIEIKGQVQWCNFYTWLSTIYLISLQLDPIITNPHARSTSFIQI